VKAGILSGFDGITHGVLAMAGGIAKTFWAAIQKTVDAFKWLADKVITSGYELHLIDDKELIKANAMLQAMAKGPEDFIGKQKRQASNFTTEEWTGFYEAAKGQSSDLETRLKSLDQAMANVFRNDNKPDPLNGLLDKGMGKLDELKARFAALMQDATHGESLSRKGPQIDLPEIDSTKAGASKIIGSFSGAAISGAGFGPLAKKQEEANKWLKQIAKNTAQPTVGVFA
jgi:hypothetical protein